MARIQLLNVQEVAAMLRVKPSTVYSWVAQGRIPHVVLARGRRKACIRFRLESVEAWLAERERAAANSRRRPPPQS